MKVWFVLGLVIWCFLALICASYIVGCSVSHPTVGPSPTISHGPGTTPHGLEHVATWLEVFMVAGIPLAVAGIVMFFLAPEAHRLSIFFGVGGVTLFTVSALLKLSLWLLPWLAGGLGVLAVLALAYELYVKISKNPKTPDLLSQQYLAK